MQGTLYPVKGRGLIPGTGAEEAAEAGRGGQTQRESQSSVGESKIRGGQGAALGRGRGPAGLGKVAEVDIKAQTVF